MFKSNLLLKLASQIFNLIGLNALPASEALWRRWSIQLLVSHSFSDGWSYKRNINILSNIFNCIHKKSSPDLAELLLNYK
jgi:hypothetical protein